MMHAAARFKAARASSALLPWLTNLTMRQKHLVPYRTRVVSGATGRVLEIGIGFGLNLPFYGQSVKQIVGLDPSAELLEMARVGGSASVDTVVTTGSITRMPNTGWKGRRHRSQTIPNLTPVGHRLADWPVLTRCCLVLAQHGAKWNPSWLSAGSDGQQQAEAATV